MDFTKAKIFPNNKQQDSHSVIGNFNKGDSKMATVGNKEVKVGDWVWFKADVEQCGKVIKIKGSMLILQASDNDDDEDTFDGDYIGGDSRTEVRASDCWLN